MSRRGSENEHLFENGLGVMLDEETGTTRVTVTLDGSAIVFASALGNLSPADRELLIRVLGEEGLDLFASGTTGMVQRLRGAGVGL